MRELTLFQIVKCNNELKELLNINLYNYQKEYEFDFFKYTNPLNYNLEYLYKNFTDDNLFEDENGKTTFIKTIKELFPEEQDIVREEDPKDKKIFRH